MLLWAAGALIYRGRQLKISPEKGKSWSTIYDENNDTISYNGFWRIPPDVKDEILQIQAHEPNQPSKTATFKPGVIDLDGQTPRMYVGIDYMRGSSGSPKIYAKNELVGLYGFGMNVDEGYISIISSFLD